MAMTFGFLQPAETDGTTLAVTTGAASAVQTAYANAYILVTCAAAASAAAGVTMTFGSSGALNQLGNTGGKVPATPSATVGFFVNANTAPQIFWLGPNRDSFRFFNATAGTITVSWQLLMP